ncbi:hypothetical protein FRC98_09050 [Lujinxingia vulgaris]|uniref:Uncharacterized protein n=1 Tax=Lujinxingia vulgaris TaxID=2600176 RepID=A0A5C6X8Y2_9DELT|nr:hypothetical protein [Lujinxingia vulgaris]TXD37818.1 hypothetical protein FRC98_09050 [Lujinxingia vulgaris]
MQLVEGLRRNPERDDALDLLLYVYTRQIEHPGVESDVLRALEGNPARGELLGLLEAELHAREKVSMARALVQLAREQGVAVVPPQEETPDDEAPDEELQERSDADIPGDDDEGVEVGASAAADEVGGTDALAEESSGAVGAPEVGAKRDDPVAVQRARVMRREVGLPTTDEIERRHPRRPKKRRAALVGVLLIVILVAGMSAWAGWDHARRARLITALDTELVRLNHLDGGALDEVLAQARRSDRQSPEVVEREAFARALRAMESMEDPVEREALRDLLGDEVLTEWGMAARSLLASASEQWEEATEYAVLAERTHPGRLATLYARGRLCEARGQWSCAQGAYQRVLGQHEDFEAARTAMMRLAAHRYDRELWEHHRAELSGEHCYTTLRWVDPFGEVAEAPSGGDASAGEKVEAPGIDERFCRAFEALATAVEARQQGGAWEASLVEAGVGRAPALAVAQVVAGLASAEDYDPEAARDYFAGALADPGLRPAFYRQVQIVGPEALVAVGRPDLALALTVAVEESAALLTDTEDTDAQTRAAAIARREAARPAHLISPPERRGELEARALLARARVLREMGATEHAVHALEALLGVEGWADRARLELARVHVVGGRQRAARLVAGQIKDAELQGRARAALALATGDFNQVVEHRTGASHWDDRRSRALGYLALKRGRDAAAALDGQLALEPTRLRVYSRLGELPESFEATMERWNQVDPRGVSHLVDLGAAAFWRRDLELASDYFERAHAIAPDHPEVNWHLGLIARLDDATARARGYFRKSWRGDENDASLLIELGRVHLDFERYEMAREAFLLAVLRDRRSVTAVAGLGRAYELGDPARGRRDLRQLLRDYSSSPTYAPAVAEMNKWLAILHGARRGDEAAAPFLARARQEVGDRADVLVELGRYHLAREEASLAREHFALALQKNPTLPAPHWGLARLALADGDRERAEDHLERLEALGARAPWPQRAEALRDEFALAGISDGSEDRE